jgi:hypothetical protein
MIKSVDVVGLGWNAKFNPKTKAANMLQNIKISNIIFIVFKLKCLHFHRDWTIE